MNTKQQQLISAVNKGESVRIIRGDVDGMKVLEWIDANLPKVKWNISLRNPTDMTECDRHIQYFIENKTALTFSCDDYGENMDHTFQASDLIQTDYERIGGKFEHGGKWWQEVKAGQVIDGEVEFVYWDCEALADRQMRVKSKAYTTTSNDYPWMIGHTGLLHLALPTTPPSPKKITMADIRELVGCEFEIVEGKA